MSYYYYYSELYEGSQPGVLRLELDGTWTVPELARFLFDLNETYAYLNLLDVIRVATLDNLSSFSDTKHRPELAHILELTRETLRRAAFEGSDSGALLRRLVRASSNYTGDLVLQGVELHSPGWLEVVANMNPLKHLSEIICKSIDAKTARDKTKLENDTKQKKSADERAIREMEIKSQLATKTLEVISNAFHDGHGVNADARERIVNEFTNTMQVLVQNFAPNNNITLAQIQPPSLP
jgi:hypothetical protein